MAGEDKAQKESRERNERVGKLAADWGIVPACTHCGGTGRDPTDKLRCPDCLGAGVLGVVR